MDGVGGKVNEQKTKQIFTPFVNNTPNPIPNAHPTPKPPKNYPNPTPRPPCHTRGGRGGRQGK